MEQLGADDPRQIGPYSLSGRLGAGGMGAVYLGRSAGGRTVAVKVVRPALAQDADFRHRFRLEVAAARRVSGAFTASVVDADTEAGTPWMATAFVVGVSLQEAVARHGPLPEDTVRTLAAGLAEALVEVHRADLIHRDLKPPNVLLALDGPHVIDFGISRAADGIGLTTTGAVVGSAPYMSPEQALGERVTPAGDVFSLGSTLAYAALGSHLFGEGAGAAVLFRVVNTEPDLGAIPPALRPLVAACLAKDPANRPTPRQVVEFVVREGRAVSPAGWLPPAVAADVLAVRAVLTGLPQAPPGLPPGAVQANGHDPAHQDQGRYEQGAFHDPSPSYDQSGPYGSSDSYGQTGHGPARQDQKAVRRGPGRRTLLLGLGGAALAAGAAGGVLALTRRGSGKAAAPRPSAEAVREGTRSWQVDLDQAGQQVLSTEGVVAVVSNGWIRGLDDQGRTAWTLDGAALGAPQTAFALGGAVPATVAGVDGNRLYAAAVTWPTSGPPTDIQTRSLLLSIDPAGGKLDWQATLDQPHAGGVLRFCGFLGGRAYVIGMGDGRDYGLVSQGYHVWAVALATHRTAWFQGDGTLILQSALPQGDDRALFAGPDEVKALDGKGDISWSKKIATVGVAAAGRHFLVTDKDGNLSALDPATGTRCGRSPAPSWRPCGEAAPSPARTAASCTASGRTRTAGARWAPWTARPGTRSGRPRCPSTPPTRGASAPACCSPTEACTGWDRTPCCGPSTRRTARPAGSTAD
ncbi:protein kinase [Kitasatospora sp. NPDC048239]|uniref:protein kinase domain-containing protein n=1 Tax=Kitasatospora sp. NPDC048239 TaxID=3364046 RepID=UPI003717BE22